MPALVESMVQHLSLLPLPQSGTQACVFFLIEWKLLVGGNSRSWILVDPVFWWFFDVAYLKELIFGSAGIQDASSRRVFLYNLVRQWKEAQMLKDLVKNMLGAAWMMDRLVNVRHDT